MLEHFKSNLYMKPCNKEKLADMLIFPYYKVHNMLLIYFSGNFFKKFSGIRRYFYHPQKQSRDSASRNLISSILNTYLFMMYLLRKSKNHEKFLSKIWFHIYLFSMLTLRFQKNLGPPIEKLLTSSNIIYIYYWWMLSKFTGRYGTVRELGVKYGTVRYWKFGTVLISNAYMLV